MNRAMLRPGLPVCLLPCLIALSTAAHGQAIAPTPAETVAARAPRGPVPTLVRCMPDRAMSCLEVTLLRPIGASGVGSVDTTRAAWAATVGASRLIGPGIIRLGFDSTRTIRLLVAVDVSGSMKGEGIAFTRSALRSFLSALPQHGMEVALVPWESHGLAARFANATFTPPAGALASLETLPPVAGNTGLYSAIAEGLRALDRRGGIPGATVLLVLTDGRNDVDNAGDDPGLLTSDAGRQEAQRLIMTARHQTWLVGVGSGVDAAELGTLAGNKANASVVAMDPGALLSLLGRIRLSLATQYTLAYGVPATTAARLGRRPMQVVVRGDSVRLGRWRPPLLARPPFQGVVDSALLSPDLRLLAESGETGRTDRLIVGLALLSVLLATYALLWRLSGESGAVVPTAAAAPAAPATAKRRGASTLRPDATDAPPRSAQDITKDEAA